MEKSLTLAHVYYNHDIALAEQGGIRPTSGYVCLMNICIGALLACGSTSGPRWH